MEKKNELVLQEESDSAATTPERADECAVEMSGSSQTTPTKSSDYDTGTTSNNSKETDDNENDNNSFPSKASSHVRHSEASRDHKRSSRRKSVQKEKPKVGKKQLKTKTKSNDKDRDHRRALGGDVLFACFFGLFAFTLLILSLSIQLFNPF